MPPIPFDGTAVRSDRLMVAAVVREERKPRSRFADLLIAATAHADGLDLYTRNDRDFVGIGDIVLVIKSEGGWSARLGWRLRPSGDQTGSVSKPYEGPRPWGSGARAAETGRGRSAGDGAQS